MSTPDLSKAAPLATSPISAVVDAFLKPTLTEMARKSKAERDSFLIEKRFPIYLESAVAEHSFLQTVVFQNAKQPLLALYQPLTVKRISQERSDETGILIDSYHPDFLPQHRHVLLIDDAGMGKSTVLRFLFLKCIEERAGLPIFFELRALKADQPIVAYLCEKLAPLDEKINPDALAKLIAAGIFTFFIDGYDEIPESQREGVTQNLRDFFSKSDLNKFILSSRPDPILVSFAGLQGFSIQGLKIEEAYALIRKYGALGGPAEELIAELERDRSSVEEFLENPMLVSLLFKAFSFKRSVPLEKPAFYNQVFDALFEGHDLTKPLYKREMFSKLSRDKFEQVLRALGIVTLKHGVGYPKSQVLAYIETARVMSGLEFDPSDFLRDLLRQVPLFAAEGDFHRWKHKSLQEYFAAKYIWLDAKENQAVLLRKAMGDKKVHYKNMLSIFYDLDYRSFRNVLTKDFLEDFIAYHETSYVDISRDQVSEKDVEFRKSFFFKNGLQITRTGDNGQFGISWSGGYNFARPRLIFDKGEDVFYKFNLDHKKWKESNMEISKLILDGKGVVNEDPETILNSKANFKRVNDFLESFFFPRLDINKCRTLLAEITLDVEREKNSSIGDLI